MSDTPKINDGGPAFPTTTDSWQGPSDGMTLRDWFAGQAIDWARQDCDTLTIGELCEYLGVTEYDSLTHWPAAIAKRAYSIADAMLAERAEGGAS